MSALLCPDILAIDRFLQVVTYGYAAPSLGIIDAYSRSVRIQVRSLPPYSSSSNNCGSCMTIGHGSDKAVLQARCTFIDPMKDNQYLPQKFVSYK